MGKAASTLLLVCLILTGPVCHAQTAVKVSDPRLEFTDNRLLISYDLLHSDPDEKYVISLDIKDGNGNPIHANTLSGDIGILDEGGKNKQITWNLEADNVYLDAYVYIQIDAEVIPPPEPVIEDQPEAVAEESPAPQADISTEEEAMPDEEEDMQNVEGTGKPETEMSEEIVPSNEPPSGAGAKSYNRAGLVLQSLALPGLGLSRLTGKPHWLRAVAGYGLVAGSITLDRMAFATYNGIEDLVQFDDITAAHKKSSQQVNTSEILAYAAIGVWVVDVVWTLTGTSDLSRETSYLSERGISINGVIDPVSTVPMLGIHYRF